MLKIYLMTIILFYLSFALCMVRLIVNKGNINLKSNTETWFTLIRLVAIGCIPIINIIFTLMYIYLSVLAEREKFIEFMN